MLFNQFLYLSVILTAALCKNFTNEFYQLNVGVDKNSLWYVNSSITNQDQQLRLDIAQPYVWVLNGASNPHATVPTYEVNESNITPFSLSYSVYNFSFIDNIAMNCTPYMTNMSISDLQKNPYVQGDSSIDELVVDSLGFMVAYDSHSLMGGLGLSGYINNTDWQNNQVASNNFNSSFMFLDDLKNENVISHAGFSLWAAGDAYDKVRFGKTSSNYSNAAFSNYSVGSLMMNYVNSSLFTGDLVKFNSIPYHEVFDEGQSFSSDGYPIFPLSGCNLIANNSESVNLTTSRTINPVLLDSRFTASFLPIDIIQQISLQTNAFYVESVESWYVNCELANINAEVEFLFGQLPIRVPLSEFITEAYLSNKDGSETPLYFKSVSGEKTNACILKMKPSYLSGLNILGVPFLKYSYLVGDLEANEYALAQAALFGDSDGFEDHTDLAKHKRNKKDTTVLSSPTSSVFVIPSSLTASSKSSSISLQGDAETAKFMSSGYIPFAKSSNITETGIVLTTFSAASTQSKEYGSNILELFGYNFTYGSIFTNGEIVTQTKSFYETALSSYELTTISGSTYYSAISTDTKKAYSSDLASMYIITVEYETVATKIEKNTTLYGTSTLTVVTDVQANATRSSKSKNLGNSVVHSRSLLMKFVHLLCAFTTIIYII